MSDKFSKGVIINDKFRGKKIMDRIRKKYENMLSQDGMSASEISSITSTQTNLKKGMAEVLHDKSSFARKEMYKKMGFTFEDRKKFEETHFSGGKLSKHETNLLKKKLERVKNRNRAMSKRQRDEFAGVMGDSDLNPKKSAQINGLRSKMKMGANVKDTAASRLGVNYRKNVTNFAGGDNNSSSSGSRLGGNNPKGLTGGASGNSGGNFKLAA